MGLQLHISYFFHYYEKKPDKKEQKNGHGVFKPVLSLCQARNDLLTSYRPLSRAIQ